MERSEVKFRARDQVLTFTGGIRRYASDTVNYVEAYFELQDNWSGFDVIAAVWNNGSARIATDLDSDGKCRVPQEVLSKKGDVYVNLTGTTSANGAVTERLTTYPVWVLVVEAKSHIKGSETAEITPSQFEQFVTEVKADADRAETVRDEAEAARDVAVSAKDTAVNAVEGFEDIVDTATATAVQTIQGEGATQVTAIQTEGTTQVASVRTEGSTQVTAVQDKGDEVLDSIPADYTQLSQNVTDLKSDTNRIVNGLNDSLFSITQKPNFFNGAFPNIGTIDNSGADTSISGYVRTNRVDVDNTESTIYFLRETSGYLLQLAFYTSANVFISKTTLFSRDAESLSGSIAIPPNAKYLKMFRDEGSVGWLQLSYINYGEYLPYSSDIYVIKDGSIPIKAVDSEFKETIDKLSAQAFGESIENINYQNGRYIQNGYDNSVASYINSVELLDSGVYQIPNIGSAYQYGIWQYISDSSANTVISFTSVGFENVILPKDSKICIRKLDGTAITLAEKKALTSNFILKRKDTITSNQKIVFLGDSIFGLERGATSVPLLCQHYTGAKSYNCALGGTHGNAHGDTTWDWFDFTELSKAIASGDFSNQLAHTSDSGVPSYFAGVITELSNIDFSDIDIICLTYGGNDYTKGVTDVDAFINAMVANINRIITAFPNIRVLMMTPPYKMFLDSSFDIVDDGDTHQNALGRTLRDYVNSYKTISETIHMPYINAYDEMGINRYNSSQWFITHDGSHPNQQGRQEIAKLVSEYLKRMIID